MNTLHQGKPFAHLTAEKLAAIGESFTLLDVGCSGGMSEGWRIFGDCLHAFGFDPNVAEIARLRAAETLPRVEYVAAFVGVPDTGPLTGQMQARPFFSRNPFARSSAFRTHQLRAAETAQRSAADKREMNLWRELELAPTLETVVIPDFLAQRSIHDVDFIKIDVDGPDYLILQSLDELFNRRAVLGVMAEVNYFGSGLDTDNSLHNMDRLLKRAGMDLCDLTIRRYSMAALPSPFALRIPAQTVTGRPVQGDALYLLDVCDPRSKTWADDISPLRLLKLAALYSLFELPDAAAEILVQYRPKLHPLIDVDAGLDALLRQYPHAEGMTYTEYMQAYEADDLLFYPDGNRL